MPPATLRMLTYRGSTFDPAADAHGPVAQLGERLVRNEEVSGSIPLSSTNPLHVKPPAVRHQAVQAFHQPAP